jgi:DNA-binding Lrp family transcriptional regulator
MMKESDLKIISHLRSGRRKKVTEISRDLDIPVTTLYDRLDALKRQANLHHTTLVDFKKLGYKGNIHMGFKVGGNDRDALESYLARHPALNSLYRVNHDFDFLAHLIFKDIEEMKSFLSTLSSEFTLLEVKIFDVVDELKKETFLSK